jgi:unsaturated rhamnogalacturonyl hydrolase
MASPTARARPAGEIRPAASPDNVALARAIADRYVAVHDPTKLAWDWGESVLMTALTDLSQATGDTKYRDFVKRWADHYTALGPILDPPVYSSDSSAPAIPNVALFRDLRGARYRDVVDHTTGYLDHWAARTSDGGISHYPIVPPTLWADSLFMFGEVMIRVGELDGNAARLAQYGQQYQIFATHLQDASGWFHHAYNWVLSQQDPDVYWGRGNGWVITSATDYLRVLAARGGTDPAVSASVGQLAHAIVDSQDASGLWWTVVNRPGQTYLETSGSALFTTGLARAYRLGLLDASVKPTIERAVAGLRTKIVNDDQGRPIVTGTSGPTDPGHFADYAGVKQQDDLTYGVGSVITALMETADL